MTELRLGRRAIAPLAFTFERVAEPLRLFIVNADESGSMSGQLGENLKAYDALAAVIGGRADLVVLHGFESDSRYDLVLGPKAQAACAEGPLRDQRRLTIHHAPSPERAVSDARAILAARTTGGTTNPASHADFLKRLLTSLEGYAGELELAVVNSSDGGLDGGPTSANAKRIREAMLVVSSRCRCLAAANVLVGSSGSPEALAFFTGDLERYDNRLLFSTVKASEGILALEGFDPRAFALATGELPRFTLQPGLPVWRVEGERLLVWVPEDHPLEAATVTVRRFKPLPGGREAVERAEARLVAEDVKLDQNAKATFELIAQSLSDNPYLRDASREALNGLIAPLEALLGTRKAVLAMVTARPGELDAIEPIRARLAENTAAIGAVIAEPALTPRERSSRLNALNNARHLLKAELRTESEAVEQRALERELGFYEAHPNHWLVWLQPAIDALKAQLGATQADPGDVMAHLSTRIRTAKSASDGQQRAADRYLDKILAESRSRRDHLARKADPRDLVAFETPGRWLSLRCPVSGVPLTEGLAAIPFVADRSDLTAGNLMAGGQNVDRMPIDRGPMLSMGAVQELMWGELGQMASVYCTGEGFYNAAIPVLLGPATPAGIRDLERAIGWLCTGTSAFGPQMAEAIPASLAVLLGAPDRQADDSVQVQALLRTSALLNRFRSYPYAAGTAVFDESGEKLPLTEVWAKSVADGAGAACLQSFGCATSLFARALAAERVDVHQVSLDLFSWGCRNLARSVLSADESDGRGGVEGLARLAALFGVAVDLEGYEVLPEALSAPSPLSVVDPGGILDEVALGQVLGTALIPLWGPLTPVPVVGFTEALNQRLSALVPADQAVMIGALGGIFDRLDAMTQPPAPPPADEPVQDEDPPDQAVVVTGQPHRGFEAWSLDALKPRRIGTRVPGLASSLCQARRVLHGGKTRWIPPVDAACDPTETSAMAFLEAHTAMYPLRAWLRLVGAGLVGRPALEALRAKEVMVPIAPLPRFFEHLAMRSGGEAALMRMARRAFAFVLKNANGYADNQWATSPLRSATVEEVEVILGALPAPQESPRRYGAADRIRDESGPHWPWMDAQACLPKSRAVDSRGQTTLTVVLPPEERVGEDAAVCQRASARMLAVLVERGALVVGGLHREARAVLGAHPVDLHRLAPDELDQAIVALVPTLAGRVRGDRNHPRFFADCATVLYQMARLGTDTRTFRSAEPPEFLAHEAARIRAEAVASSGPA